MDLDVSGSGTQLLILNCLFWIIKENEARELVLGFLLIVIQGSVGFVARLFQQIVLPLQVYGQFLPKNALINERDDIIK